MTCGVPGEAASLAEAKSGRWKLSRDGHRSRLYRSLPDCTLKSFARPGGRAPTPPWYNVQLLTEPTSQLSVSIDFTFGAFTILLVPSVLPSFPAFPSSDESTCRPHEPDASHHSSHRLCASPPSVPVASAPKHTNAKRVANWPARARKHESNTTAYISGVDRLLHLLQDPPIPIHSLQMDARIGAN